MNDGHLLVDRLLHRLRFGVLPCLRRPRNSKRSISRIPARLYQKGCWFVCSRIKQRNEERMKHTLSVDNKGMVADSPKGRCALRKHGTLVASEYLG